MGVTGSSHSVSISIGVSIGKAWCRRPMKFATLFREPEKFSQMAPLEGQDRQRAVFIVLPPI